MKRLLIGLAIAMFVPAIADVTIDTTRQTSYDYACVDGSGKVLSSHQRQDKAIASCAERAANDEDGVYDVQGGRWRVEVSGVAEAAAIIVEPNFGNLYTVTHYVAPFAEVPGAGSDEDPMDSGGDNGAAAYAAATDPAFPTTLMAAARNATAGDVIQLSPGVYSSLAASDPPDSWVPRFEFTNNGTASEPIVLVAEYPAAYNSGSPSLLSEFRQTYGNTTNEEPWIFWGLQGQYHIIDGIFIDESISTPKNDTGFVGIGQNAVGSEIRRSWADRTGATGYANDDNRSPFWASDSIGSRIVDNLITGDGSVTSRNCGSIQAYRAENLVVEYNTISGAPGIYIKAEVFPGTYQLTNVHVRNNLVTDIRAFSLRTSSARTIYIYNNIFEANEYGYGIQLHGAAADTYSIPVWAYNNTVITTGFDPLNDGHGVGIFVDNQRENADQTEIYNNIFVDATSSGHWLVNTIDPPNLGEQGYDPDHDDIDGMARFNNNVYYAVNVASPLFARDIDHPSNPVQTFTGLTDYRTNFLDPNFGSSPVYAGENYEDASISSDPEFVSPNYSDVASGDWCLQNNGQGALTVGATSTLISDLNTTVAGACVTGSEEFGLRADPTY